MDAAVQKKRQQARNTVVRLLKLRPRSQYEIKSKLKAKNFNEEVITETLDHFTQADLINDRSFTRGWISARLNKPFGFLRIQHELIQKGIDRDIINEELEAALKDYREEDIVLELAQRRLKQYGQLEPQHAQRRLMGFLSRRGFPAEAIRKALQKLS